MTTPVDTEPVIAPSIEDEWILQHTRDVIEAYLQTRGKADFARSVKSMTDHTVHEYGGRFLLELLQNGYDANSRHQASGRIAVVVKHDEGDHGVVYVANTGVGFTRSNVHAISNLGLSDKPVGEGIGNKGVGFKSVLQVSAAPEIYSRGPADEPGGRGYRFRFATPNDIHDIVPDEATAEDVLANVSLLNLIVPLRTVPQLVTQLWNDGYVTVVRLPLRSEAARSEAAARLSDLRESQVPVMLFLRRLQSILLEEDRSDAHTVLELSRYGADLEVATAVGRAQRVKLNDEQEYYVFARDIDADRLRKAVSEAVAEERLDQRWLDWQAPASVSLAVPIGGDAIDGRCYTYLPLGAKAPSPFAGHLNAPFFTNLARLDLDETNPLNYMLLNQAAELCLSAAAALAVGGDADASRAAVDLITWNAASLPHLHAAASGGDPLIDRPLIPTLNGHWAAMTQAQRWPLGDADVLTAQLAHDACGLELLRNDLGDARETRLAATLQALDVQVDPTVNELADAVEMMMSHCLQASMTLERWELAYDDIAVIFAKNADAIAGRRLLLTEDLTLGPCATRGNDNDRVSSIPYFPPVRQRVDDEDEVEAGIDLALPRALQGRRLFYLHSGLRWYDESRQQTRARRFLQDGRLVRRFDTRSILEHLATVLVTSRSRAVHAEALRFTHNAATANRATNVALNELGIRVPTVDGELVPANEALFTADWPNTNGADLTTIATTPDDVSPELSALRRQLIASPDQLLRTSDDRNAWTEFLRKLGVTDRLPVRAVRDSTLRHGGRLTRHGLTSVAGLPETVSEQWRMHLREHSTARYPETPYRARSDIYWLPGQAEYSRLPSRVRIAYTRLVIIGLKTWSDECFTTTWERDRAGDKDPEPIPTPLQAFIATAEWLRVRTTADGETFQTARDSWYYPVRGNELPPRFTPLISKSLRDLIDDDPRAVSRLAAAGIGQWTSPADAARLIRHLGDLLASGEVADVHLSQLDRTYRQAWATVAARADSQIYPVQQQCHIVVDIGGRLTAVNIAEIPKWESDERILVTDATDDATLLRVLSEFSQPLLRLDRDADAVTGILAQRLGKHVARVRGSELTVIVDGHPFQPGTENPTLLTEAPWLRLVVATVVAHPRGAFTHLGERAFHDTIDALARIRLVRCTSLAINVSEQTRELPDQLNGVLPVTDDEHPSLALCGHSDLTWTTLEALAEPLARLLNRPQLAPELALTLLKLQTAGVTVTEGPTHADVAAACNVTEQNVIHTMRRLDTALAPVLERLQPIVAHYCGVDAAHQFDPDGDNIRSDEELVAALADIATQLPEAPATLLNRARETASHDELRRALGISLTEHNATLRAIGGRHQAIDNTEQHNEEFTFYVSSRWSELSQRIRWARLPRFAAHDVGDDWPQLRRRTCITVDGNWGTTIDTLDEGTMAARVDSELHRLLGEEPPANGPALEPLDDVRRANAELVDKVAESMTVAVRAWLVHAGQAVEVPWNVPGEAAAHLRAKLDGAGAFDFVRLDAAAVIEWLRALKIWPTEMPASYALDDLGLTTADVDAQRSEAERERLAKQRARRIVEIDGQEYDTENGLTLLRDALKVSLAETPAFTAGSQPRFTRLAEIAQPRGGHRRGNGSGGGGPHREQLSDPQRHAIGFAGEWLVYEWLRSAYGDVVTEDCWKSSYRAVEFPGDPGDDGLGYDFLVPARGGDLMFEVKATRGTAGEIQLGESEVRTAQENARNRRWRLMVVEHALTAERRRLLLPNPFSPASRGRYAFAGQGLRLRFNPA